MRRITMMLFAAILFISFAACSGSKKENVPEEKAATETVEKTVETPAPETPAPVAQTPDEALKAFKGFVKEYAEAYNNIAKDPSKFQTLGGQLQQKVADMERLKIDFTEKQLKEYQKAMDLIREVNTGGKK